MNNMNNNQGMALLITLAIITVLIAATMEINRQVRASVAATAAVRDQIVLTEMARSGIHAAMALLIKDRQDSDYDTLVDDWALEDNMNELLSALAFETGSVSVLVLDELGKIQVNALVAFPDNSQFNPSQRMLWDRFLRQLLTDRDVEEESEPIAIINSIKDWLDFGDDEAITGLSGAESGYYNSLEPAYDSGNSPISELGELLLVKGITPELFYGSEEDPGLAFYLTVYSQTDEAPAGEAPLTYAGRVNINTASLPVLTALLPSANETLAEAMLEYRQSVEDPVEDRRLADPQWYKDIPGFAGIDIDPDLVTTSTNIFSIVATAELHGTKQTILTVVKRESLPENRWRCRILSWQTI